VLPTERGSLRLFRFSGIQVYLHWSWFAVALYEIQTRRGTYSSMLWNALEYLGLFLIVLMHEFGHSLACRSVGGKADQIVLWPLGGVAYVNPPQRPGATLWSIAAGPLVNVLLAPMLTVLWVLAGQSGWDETMPNAFHLVETLWQINLVLLIFNLMPVYPLDGGQIFRSILWFFMGRARSLMVASMVGFGGVALIIVLAIYERSIWTVIVGAFILMNCWRGLLYARVLTQTAKLPRRAGYACPSCREAPIIGRLWTCPNCRVRFDTFDSHAVCPSCGLNFPVTTCLDCGEASPFPEWVVSGALPPVVRE
jgi:Zn-dependent protease